MFSRAFSTFAILLLLTSCAAGRKPEAQQKYYETVFVCTGDTTRYPLFTINATKSLFEVISEEMQVVRMHYSGYKITGYSAEGDAKDFISLSRRFYPDVVIACDVRAFWDADRGNYHRMSPEEAKAIVKCMLKDDLLAVKLSPEDRLSVDSWPFVSEGTLNILSPGKGWKKRYVWEFRDWVHSLEYFGPMSKNMSGQ